MEDAKLSTNTCHSNLQAAVEFEKVWLNHFHFQIKNYSQQISRGATFTLISLFLVCSALFTISVLLGKQLGIFADKIFHANYRQPQQCLAGGLLADLCNYFDKWPKYSQGAALYTSFWPVSHWCDHLPIGLGTYYSLAPGDCQMVASRSLGLCNFMDSAT